MVKGVGRTAVLEDSESICSSRSLFFRLCHVRMEGDLGVYCDSQVNGSVDNFKLLVT